MPRAFSDADALAPLFSLQCRSHPRKSSRALPGGCPHEHDPNVDSALRGTCGAVLAQVVAVLDVRIATLLAAVDTSMPGLRGRLKVGADVTLRRTVKGKHGDDVVATGDVSGSDHVDGEGSGRRGSSTCSHARRDGCGVGIATVASTTDNDAAAANTEETRTTANSSAAAPAAHTTAPAAHTAAPAAHTTAPVHCDSWDGTIMCFGLCSTKLGTPVYPDAVFPQPLHEFLSQSATGKSYPSQLPSDAAVLGRAALYVYTYTCVCVGVCVCVCD